MPILKKAIETDAVKYLTEGIDCNPADSRRSLRGALLARGQLARCDLDNALAAAESASKEDDRMYLPRLALAAVHLARQDQVNAVVAVQECVRTKPDLNQEEVTSFVGERLGARVWAITRSLQDRGE